MSERVSLPACDAVSHFVDFLCRLLNCDVNNGCPKELSFNKKYHMTNTDLNTKTNSYTQCIFVCIK